MTTRITTDNITDATITTTDIAATVPLAVDWQASDIKTANFTAESGKGYFCNTGSGAFTATLPADAHIAVAQDIFEAGGDPGDESSRSGSDIVEVSIGDGIIRQSNGIKLASADVDVTF